MPRSSSNSSSTVKSYTTYPHPVPRTFQWTGPIMPRPSGPISVPPSPNSQTPTVAQSQQPSFFSSIQQGFGWGIGTSFARSLFESSQAQDPYKDYKQCIQNGKLHDSCKHLINDGIYKQCVVSGKSEIECLPDSVKSS